MTYIQAPHETDAEKLASVKAQMGKLGAPKIKAHYNGEMWLAVEGSHRIAAAYELGFDVDIVEVELDDEIEHDLDDVRGNTVEAVLEYLELSGPCYDFEI